MTESALAGLAPPKRVRPRDPETGRLVKVAASTSPLADKPPEEPVAEIQEAEPRAKLADGRERIPFGAIQRRLDEPARREGFYRRYFNDMNDNGARIERAERAGYVMVQEHGQPWKRHVGLSSGGQPLYAYLMEIPIEFRNEDFEIQQAKLDEQDAQIHRGSHGEKPDDMRYVPRDGRGKPIIDMRVQKGRGRG